MRSIHWNPNRANELLIARSFHPWEGGEGRVTRQYVVSLTELAKQALRRRAPLHAIEHLERARSYPPNLGEGKLQVARENDVHYYLGRAHAAARHGEAARHHFQLAASCSTGPTSATHDFDQRPEVAFCRGLAPRALGREGESNAAFARLVAYGREHLHDQPAIDYFAVSLPDFLVFDDDLALRNRVHCHFMMALGSIGLGDVMAARQHLERVLTLDVHHSGAALCTPDAHNARSTFVSGGAGTVPDQE